MGRKPIYSPEDKMQIVLSVLRGETTQSDIARRLQMSQTTIAKWQKQFLQGGIEALSRGENARPPSSKHEEELETQVEELTTALGEAYVELRVWRKGGLSTPVRGDRGRPRRGRRAGFEAARSPRDPALDLVLLAGLPSLRTAGQTLAGPGRRYARDRGGRICAQVVSMGPSQDLRDDARGRSGRVRVECTACDEAARPRAPRTTPQRAA